MALIAFAQTSPVTFVLTVPLTGIIIVIGVLLLLKIGVFGPIGGLQAEYRARRRQHHRDDPELRQELHPAQRKHQILLPCRRTQLSNFHLPPRRVLCKLRVASKESQSTTAQLLLNYFFSCKLCVLSQLPPELNHNL